MLQIKSSDLTVAHLDKYSHISLNVINLESSLDVSVRIGYT